MSAPRRSVPLGLGRALAEVMRATASLQGTNAGAPETTAPPAGRRTFARARDDAPAGGRSTNLDTPPRAATKKARPRRGRAVAPDEFGLDPAFRQRALPVFRLLFQRYWRVEARGVRNVPRSGPVILVSNHSGGVPFDATMIAYALEEARHPRATRFLYDRFVDHLPWVPEVYRKAGGVVATHENAAKLLDKGELVGLFPEGVGGLAKLYSERYVLQPFSGGFIRLALRFQAPIVPVAVCGAEEIYPLVGRLKSIGKLLGVPYVPVTPFFPLLGPLGMIPLPTKWTIQFGKPLRLNVSAARPDAIAVRAMADQVRGHVQRMLTRLLRERRSIF